MKRMYKSVICSLLCVVMLLGFVPAMQADAASADRLDALSLYHQYLKDEIAALGTEVRDEAYYNMFTNKIIKPAITQKILGAHLIDVTGDGIEEFFLTRQLSYKSNAALDIGNKEWTCVYTYVNGQLQRLGQSEDWIKSAGNNSWSYYEPDGYIGSIVGDDGGIFICTGSDGKTYFSSRKPAALWDETVRFFGYNGSTFKQVVEIESNFIPDWYISSNIHSSYGKYVYYIDDVKVSEYEYNNALKRYCSSYYRMENNDYNIVLGALETELKSYYTPSSWASVEVNMGINSGYVPINLQKNYTKPITRAEFCALATNLYETTTGKTITDLEHFGDTSDLSVQKMAGLGIVTGTGNGNFSPNKNLTRQEAATILGRLADALNMQTQESELTFADNDDIAAWAKPSVAKLLSVGIMGGVGGNRFDPKGSYTREQAIMTIVRLSQLPIGDPIPVSSISLSPSSLSITAGESASVAATIFPADATEKKLSWTSSDESIVTVDKNGLVNAIYEGEATITATAPSGVSASCTVSVQPVKSTGIRLDRSEAFLNVGKSLLLIAKLYPENASTDHIVWTSSDESVAIVSASGLVTAFREGTATITAESFGESASCTITVSTAPLGLENFKKSNVYTGQFSDVVPTAWYAPNVAAAYEYGLMNGSNATSFNPGGNLTIAEALVIACRIHNIYYDNNHDFSGGSPWYQSYVDYAIENDIIIRGEYTEFTKPAQRADFAQFLAASVPSEALAPINNVGDGIMNDVPDLIPDVPADAVDFAPEVYKLYNAGILSGSNSYGEFKPYSSITRAEVAAIITRIADPALRKTFTLLEKEIPAESISILVDYEGMRIGENYNVQPNVYPSNTTWKDFRWTSSNPSVATVDDRGNVKAVGSGDATITVSLNGLSASYKVNVAREDIIFSGDGRETFKISVPKGAWKVEYSHNSTKLGSFIVKGVYDVNRIIEDSGNCSGTALFEPALEGAVSNYSIEVSANSEWTLRFVEVNELISSNIAGSGSCVPGLILCTGNTTVTSAYDGTDYFSANLYSLKDGRWEWAAGEIGPFDNETQNIYPQKNQMYVVYIKGDGSWTVDFGYGDELQYVK